MVWKRLHVGRSLTPSASELLGQVEPIRRRFLEAMDDDFNTGGALGELFDLVRALNRQADTNRLESADRKPADARRLQTWRGRAPRAVAASWVCFCKAPAATRDRSATS